MAKIERLRSTLFPIRLFVVLATTLIYTGLALSQWLPLRIQQIGGGEKYMDLQSVFKAVECYAEIGDSVYDSRDCVYVYGSFLLRLVLVLNLNSLSYQLLGGLLAITTVLTLVFITLASVRTWRQSIIALSAISSPSIWLLLERGNIDILVFLMTVVAAICVTSRYSLIGILLIFVSSLIKFYTLPLLALYLLVEKRPSLRFLSASALLIATPFVLIDITKASVFPNPLFIAFGLPAPGLWLNFLASQFAIPFELGRTWIYLIGFLSLAFSFYLIHFSSLARRHRLFNFSQPQGTPMFKNLFLFSSLVFLTCFLLGMNFNYRLIFLVTALLLMNVIFPDFYFNNWNGFVSFVGLWFTVFYFGNTGAIFVGLAVLANVAQIFLATLLMYAVYQTLELPSSVKQNLQRLVSPRERH